MNVVFSSPSSTSALFSKVMVNSTKCMLKPVGATFLYQIVTAPCSMVAVSPPRANGVDLDISNGLIAFASEILEDAKDNE